MNSLEIKKIRDSLDLTQSEFAKMLGVKIRAVQSWESGDRNISQSALLLLKLILETQSAGSKIKQSLDLTISEGTPYYDIDFTLSFLEVENNQQAQPDYYVTHPFFKGCDFIVRASGQSMAKVIKHGDAIGLVKIDGWQDFIPLGEIYAIVTKNGFRMIKIITKGETKESYTLLSKPSDNKKEEFPPQQIDKNQILTIYKVQASSHLF